MLVVNTAAAVVVVVVGAAAAAAVVAVASRRHCLLVLAATVLDALPADAGVVRDGRSVAVSFDRVFVGAGIGVAQEMSPTSGAEVHGGRGGDGESLVRLLMCLKMLLLLLVMMMVMLTLAVVVVVVVVVVMEVEETTVEVEAGLVAGVVAVVVEVVRSVEIQTQLSRRPEVRLEDGGDAEVGHRRRGLLTTTFIAVFIVLCPIFLGTVLHTTTTLHHVTIRAVLFNTVDVVRRHGHHICACVVTDDVNHFLTFAHVITPADVNGLTRNIFLFIAETF